MTRRNATRIAALVVIFAALATGWAVLAPPQLGGSTQYVILAGSSMEPSLRAGDLALVRRHENVEKGDVVLYRDPEIGVHVLHRVVRVQDGRYVLKGDNNRHLDSTRPTADEISGGLWFSLQHAGSAIEWARAPIHAALVVFVLAFLALGGGAAVATRRRAPALGIVRAPTPESRTSTRPGGIAQVVLGVGIAGLVVFGLLALVSHSSPLSRAQTIPDAYEHSGTFSYSAPVPMSDVYPDGLVDSGESAFLQLVPTLDVTFAYRLSAQDAASVSGDVSLTAVLSDGAGWVRRIPFADQQAFTGTSARITGRLDLAALSAVVEEMRTLTGSGTTTFSLGIVPDVDVRGRVGTETIGERFSPTLPLLLDPVSVRPDTSVGDSSLFTARRAETVTVRSPAYISVGGLRLTVDDARHVSILGLLIAALVGAVGAGALWRARGGGEPSRIAVRFGDRMITIAEAPSVDSSRVSELADVESLHRVAERYDRVVLHWQEGRGHVYLVDDGSAVYRYRVGGAPNTDWAPDRNVEDTLVLSASQIPPRAAAR